MPSKGVYDFGDSIVFVGNNCRVDAVNDMGMHGVVNQLSGM